MHQTTFSQLYIKFGIFDEYGETFFDLIFKNFTLPA